MSLKKKMSVAVAAAVCCSMISVFNAAVSAEEYTYSEAESIVSELYASDPAYTEAVKLAGLKFNSRLAKKISSYEGKKPKYSVTFEKSRTKYYFSKLYKNAVKMSEDPSTAELSVSMVSADSVVSTAIKNGKSKCIIYMNQSGMPVASGFYSDSENITILDLAGKLKSVMPVDSENSGDLFSIDTVMGDIDTAGISDSTKGKLFKFKYNGKGYYYEVFKKSDGKTVGCVFNTKLEPVMFVDDTDCYSVKITTSVKDSDVDVPEGYTGLDLEP